jgi:hypothetical protein
VVQQETKVSRVIIAGGRDFADPAYVEDAMISLSYDAKDDYAFTRPIEHVLCGGAHGADAIGQKWAVDRGILVRYFPADWDQYGKAAGPIRNRLMAASADVLVAFWDGRSKGTQHMIQCALLGGLEVHIYRYPRRD